MILVKENINVKKVMYGEDNAEMITLRIEDKDRKNRDFTVMYVPPKPRAWKEREYTSMISDTKNSLKEILKEGENTILMGDFNCKEVHWEDMSSEGGEESWGTMLLDLTMDYTMTQWIQECTRYRSGKEPSRLDLVFMKEPELVSNIEYMTPIGKSDHVLIELELREGTYIARNEKYKGR